MVTIWLQSEQPYSRQTLMEARYSDLEWPMTSPDTSRFPLPAYTSCRAEATVFWIWQFRYSPFWYQPSSSLSGLSIFPLFPSRYVRTKWDPSSPSQSYTEIPVFLWHLTQQPIRQRRGIVWSRLEWAFRHSPHSTSSVRGNGSVVTWFS